jgi:putative pyruvate formate lyase activating enzyme
METHYLKLFHDGTLQQRIHEALALLKSCELCPRRCRVNRLENERGVCRTGRHARVSSSGPHFGEEAVLTGRFGSGTIFFTECNLQCVFCQNYDISHEGRGDEITAQELADIMIGLQNMGVHNINFVSPTHVVPQILEALPYAIEKGLSIPLVYNTGGYDLVETLRLLDGIIDIFMPDYKFSEDIPALFYCKAPDYPEVIKSALREMHRQVGDLVMDDNNRAMRGLLVRHLVMPDGLAGTRRAMRFIADEISHLTYVNIMDQYHPCGEAEKFPELNRRITPQEYEEAVTAAKQEGITRLDNRQRPILLNWR